MKKDLDHLMKEWDEGEAPIFEDSAKLKQKVLQELNKRNTTPKGYSRSAIWAWGAVAALVLFFMNFTIKESPVKNNVASNSINVLSLEELKELKTVANEVKRLFPEGVRWISKVGDKLEIKTSTSESLNQEFDQIAICYVVMEKMDHGWERVHLTNIITRTGEPIELQGETRGHIWTSNMGDKVYALDSQLQFNIKGATMNINFSSGITEQENYEVKDLQIQGKQYKIFQTIIKV